MIEKRHGIRRRRPSGRAALELFLSLFALGICLVALLALIDLPYPPEGFRLVADRGSIGKDAFWAARRFGRSHNRRYRDAINPHKGARDIETLLDHVRLQRRIRMEVLLQPEIRRGSLADFKNRLDRCRKELRDLLGDEEAGDLEDVERRPSDRISSMRAVPSAPSQPLPFHPGASAASRRRRHSGWLLVGAEVVAAATAALFLRARSGWLKRRR